MRDRVLIGWLWRDYVRGRAWLMLVALLLASLEGLTLGVLSYGVQPVLDRVLVPGGGHLLALTAIAVAAVFVLRAAARMAATAITAGVSERVAAALQRDIVAHLLTLGPDFYRQSAPGTLIERVRGDSQAMTVLLRTVLPGLVRDGIGLAVLLGVALWTDWIWTLVVLVGAPLLILPLLGAQAMVRRVTREERRAAGEAARQLDEAFHGITILQVYGAEVGALGRFRLVLERFVRARVRSVVVQAAMPSLVDLFAALGLALVLVYGGAQIVGGERSIGQLMTFLVAIGLMFDPLRGLGEAGGAWQAAMASLERQWELLQARPAVAAPAMAANTPPPPRDACDIVFRDVNFAFDDGLAVLDGLSFEIAAGERVAIMGPSGAGKSTILALIARLVDPQSGAVLIGGRDLRDYDLPALRGMLALVSQDNALFDDTLLANVMMGRPDAAPDAVAQALKVAGVAGFLPRLPQGARTPVGPRGSALSGGQRQRVAIARAVLRDAPILLLDEATSALDPHTRDEVTEALGRAAAGRTTLIVTHSPETALSAQRIIEIHAGRCVGGARPGPG